MPGFLFRNSYPIIFNYSTNLESRPRIWLSWAVRALAKPCLAQCTDSIYCLLFSRLDWHKTHVWPAHCFANCLSICHVIFVALNVGFYELRWHEFDRMSKFAKPSRPVARTAAGFRIDQVGFNISEKLLLQINSYCCNLYSDAPHLFSGCYITILALWCHLG